MSDVIRRHFFCHQSMNRLMIDAHVIAPRAFLPAACECEMIHR